MDFDPMMLDGDAGGPSVKISNVSSLKFGLLMR